MRNKINGLFFIFAVVLFMSFSVESPLVAKVSALKKTNKKTKENIKNKCLSKELSLQNCYLKFQKNKIHLGKEKILFTDGVWRSIYDMPYKGEHTEWEKANVRTLGKRIFLEVKIWAQEESQLGIQSLYWSVYEIQEERLSLKLSEVIQKRRPRENQKPILDPMEPYGLKLKGHKVVWWVNHQKGEI